ncbi:MAG TPA: hypothetical protein PKC44_03410 [Agitococcus sp.]|nr:hypothetical protein [Agitococcus sp.]
MGIGNYLLVGAESVYIDKEQVYGENYWLEEDYEFDSKFLFEDLIYHIREALPSSFHDTARCWLDRERQIIAESGMFRVSIVDWDIYFSLNIEIIDDIQIASLAKYHLNKTANRIFDKLNQIYDLRVRDTAWTSGKRTLTQSAA